MPAQAGIQSPEHSSPWIPAFASMTPGGKNWQGIYEMDI
jgi:hypothetical protein